MKRRYEKDLGCVKEKVIGHHLCKPVDVIGAVRVGSGKSIFLDAASSLIDLKRILV
jgi:hypothetical protein